MSPAVIRGFTHFRIHDFIDLPIDLLIDRLLQAAFACSFFAASSSFFAMAPRPHL
jgi:hypothetical protein